MSPTSYRTAPPRDEKCIISYDVRNVKNYYRNFSRFVPGNTFMTAGDALFLVIKGPLQCEWVTEDRLRG